MYKNIKKIVWSILHSCGKIEWFFIKKAYSKKHNTYSPVFIIGLPRSGTTILYQLITNHLKISYINNFVERHYKSPFIALTLSNIIRKNKKHDCFQSNFGYSTMPFGPSEAGNLFAKWFSKDIPYWDPENTPQKLKTNFYTFITAWSCINKKSIIIKNLRFGQRIKLITHLFPDALFIYIKRSDFYTLQSMYIAGEKLTESLKTWCSNKEIINAEDLINTNYLIIKQLRESIVNDLKRHPKEKVLELNYEDICDKPLCVLDSIQEFFKKNNTDILFEERPRELYLKNNNIIKLGISDVKRIKNTINE